jgi:hypothetical protein
MVHDWREKAASEPASAIAINSLSGHVEYDIEDHVVIEQFMRFKRRLQVRKRHDIPQLRAQYHPQNIARPRIQTKALKIQRDSYTCGFWVLIYALGFLLDCSDQRILSLGAADIKDLMGSLYSSFLGDDAGVSAELLHNLVAPLEPGVDLQQYPNLLVCAEISTPSRLILFIGCHASTQPEAGDTPRQQHGSSTSCSLTLV